MTLAAATRAELRALDVDPRKDAVANLAVLLARQLDAPEDLKVVPGLARQHQAAMVEVRRVAAATKPAATTLDQLRQQRDKRAGAG